MKAASGSSDKLILGDLNARVDWSYAQDIVQAMQMILQANRPETFIVASGQAHTVKEFVELCFNYFGLDWQQFVKEDDTFLVRRPLPKIGNPSKLMRQTGWTPSLSFPDMVEQLIKDTMEKQS